MQVIFKLCHLDSEVPIPCSWLQVAYDMTSKLFGPTSALTGHRALRLGVAHFAQGKLTQAASLLQSAEEALRVRVGSP
jgi:hypothetical protein